MKSLFSFLLVLSLALPLQASLTEDGAQAADQAMQGDEGAIDQALAKGLAEAEGDPNKEEQNKEEVVAGIADKIIGACVGVALACSYGTLGKQPHPGRFSPAITVPRPNGAGDKK